MNQPTSHFIPVIARRRLRHVFICAFVLMAGMLSASPIHYQARITAVDSGTDASGLAEASFLFALFDGNDVLWNNWQGATANGALPLNPDIVLPGLDNFLHANVMSGTVSIMLGAGDAENNRAIPPETFFSDQLLAIRPNVRLAVWLRLDAGETKRLTPDLSFSTVPYSHVAGIAETVRTGGVGPEQISYGAASRALELSGFFPVGSRVMSTEPESPELLGQAFERVGPPFQLGGRTVYLYERTSVNPTFIEVFNDDGQPLRNQYPEPLDFGDPQTPETLSFTVRNASTTALEGLSFVLDGPAASAFELLSPLPNSLPLQQSEVFRIRFTPQAGEFESNSVLSISASGIGGSFVLRMRGGPQVDPGFSLIPAGDFTMGDAFAEASFTTNALPTRTVTLDAFVMERLEVTYDLWNEVRAWAEVNGYTDLSPGAGKAVGHPVTDITWYDAAKWCNARTEYENAIHGANFMPVYSVNGEVMRSGSQIPVADWNANGYRLPTEAEWERAARGGIEGKRYPWGDTISHAQANYYAGDSKFGNESVWAGYHPDYAVGSHPYSSPGGVFFPNGYGLMDMAGNVVEWTWDTFQSDYYGSGDNHVNPKGPPASVGSAAVSRGGAWSFQQEYLRVAGRLDWPRWAADNYLGFRTVRGKP